VSDNGRAHKGVSTFTVAIDPENQGVVLRRRSDQGVGKQQATVLVNGSPAGVWYTPGSNMSHRWRDSDFLVHASLTSGKSQLVVTVQFVSSDIDWNEFKYSAYSMLP